MEHLLDGNLSRTKIVRFSNKRRQYKKHQIQIISMKLNQTVVAYAMSLLGALYVNTSCDSDKAARQFAEDFAAAVSNNDAAAIARMYPDAAKADSLSLDFVADSLKISAAGDTIHFEFASGVTMTAVKDAKESIRVLSSKGLFAYDPSRLKFAKGTGWYDESLDDIVNAERLSDTLFIKFITETAVAEMKSKIKVVKSSTHQDYSGDPCVIKYMVVVANQNSRQIEGNMYVVDAKIYDTTRMSSYKEYISTKHLTGKPIPANGKATYTFTEYIGACPVDPVCSIRLNIKPEDILADYQPTGQEYDEYLAQKK